VIESRNVYFNEDSSSEDFNKANQDLYDSDDGFEDTVMISKKGEEEVVDECYVEIPPLQLDGENDKNDPSPIDCYVEIPTLNEIQYPEEALAVDEEIDGDGLSLDEAMKIPQWKNAVEDELTNMNENNVFEEVKEPPPGAKLIDTVWRFKKKLNQDGTLEKYKARLCGRGFKQRKFIDYNETSSPTLSYSALRFVLIFALFFEMSLACIDFKSAFLNAELKEELYLKMFGKTYRLLKALYGLKQASLEWYNTISSYLIQVGMIKMKCDPCIFILLNNKNHITLFVAIYVDDCIICYESENDLKLLLKKLNQKFKCGLRNLKDGFLNICIKNSDCSIEMTQPKFIDQLLKEFNMQEANGAQSPSAGNLIFSKREDEAKCPGPYESIVGSLNYLSETTRPDIRYIVSRLARFRADPGITHWNAAKRVLRYIKQTVNRRVILRRSKEWSLKCYTDAEWASDIDDRKSTCGYVIYLNGNLFVWKSVKQKSVAMSSMEAEVMGLSIGIREVLYWKYLLSELGVYIKPEVFTDNQAAISFVKSFKNRPLTKHISVRYHFIKDAYGKDMFSLHYVRSSENPADQMTKPLSGQKYDTLVQLLE
jgi:hypothetical protein